MFPQLARFTDFGLLLIRLMVGLVFITSGYNHLKDPEARSKSIGMSKGFTIFLGILGRQDFWLALRSDVHPDEPDDCLHRWRTVCAAEVMCLCGAMLCATWCPMCLDL